MAATATKTKKPALNGDRFGIIEKSPRVRVDVYASEFNGREYLHVREHFLNDEGTEWLPSKKGITLREGIQIEELIAALQAALKSF